MLNNMHNIDSDWTKIFTASDNQASHSGENKRQYEWLKSGDHYNKLLKFKLMPSNSKDNGHFGEVIAKHWDIGPNKDCKSFICVEQSSAFAGQHLTCPVCQLKRDLLAMGFKQEDFQVAGKFGPLDTLAPRLQSVVKVLMLESDGEVQNTWDQSHISILSMSGNILMKWLMGKAMDRELPDFTDLVNGNIIKFTREKENGKWDRNLMDSSIKWDSTPEQVEKIKQENEEISFSDLSQLPSDDEFTKVTQICDQWKETYIKGREAQQQAASTPSIEEAVGDNMPF